MTGLEQHLTQNLTVLWASDVWHEIGTVKVEGSAASIPVPLQSFFHTAARGIYLKFTWDAMFMDPSSFNLKYFGAQSLTSCERLSSLHMLSPQRGGDTCHSWGLETSSHIFLPVELTHLEQPRWKCGRHSGFLVLTKILSLFKVRKYSLVKCIFPGNLEN